MTSHTHEPLPPEAELAVVHTEPDLRGALRIFFELDNRLGRIVAATNEPMLGQMRLAWWRDELGKPAENRPAGDAVLDGIDRYWAGQEAALIKLADSWEHLLAPDVLAEKDARGFAEGRADALVAVYERDAALGSDRANYQAAARAWAFADMTAKVSSPEERELLIRLGTAESAALSRLPRLPRRARGLAVLGALGARALARGGRPLMEGRTASLAAARAAIFGK